MPGTSIRIFLPDGNPDGLRLISKSHWTGLALALPRSIYPDVRLSRAELRTPGVYLLIGPATDSQYEAKIYVGEGVDPRGRLDGHQAGKDFWTRLILFTSVGDGLNKATVQFIEARLLQLAAGAGRAELDNGNAPSLSPLSEADREDAEVFLGEMLVVYQLLGANFFEPLARSAGPLRLQLEGPDAKGEGAEVEDGFMVYAGALARAEAVESTPAWVHKLRGDLVDSGVFEPTGDGTSFRLCANHKFGSPSAAAAAILGRTANGTEEWRDADGKTLKELRAQTVSGVEEV